MALLAGYDSESGGDEDQQAPGAAVLDDESDASSVASDDSATLRAKEAEARLAQLEARRHSGAGAGGSGVSLLPSAASAFDEVNGPPTFLDPESTRPLAVSRQHGMPFQAPPPGPASTAWHGPKKRVPPGQEFDIARLAPQLPGSVPKQGADKRDVPAGALIEAKAKRVKASDAPVYSEAQIALMGGKLSSNDEGVLGEGSAIAAGPSAPGAARPPGLSQRNDRGPKTAAIGVTDFLAKGVGGAQLPRKAQDRKDKEQLKRAAGQSTHATWKSEAEMVLRQQYD